MLNLTEEQKEILKNLVNSKKDKKISLSNLELGGFDLPKLIRQSLSSIAIRWSDNFTQLMVYNKGGNDVRAPFFEVLDMIYFIKSLEDSKLVAIIGITNTKERSMDSYLLCDRKKYKYIETMDFFCTNINCNDTCNKTICENHQLKDEQQIIYVNLDIIKLLDRYSRSIIYPLPLLEDYVIDFKTVEQRRFDDQMSDAQEKFDKQIKSAKYSQYIALFAAFLSLAGLIIAITI